MGEQFIWGDLFPREWSWEKDKLKEGKGSEDTQDVTQKPFHGQAVVAQAVVAVIPAFRRKGWQIS